MVNERAGLIAPITPTVPQHIPVPSGSPAPPVNRSIRSPGMRSADTGASW